MKNIWKERWDNCNRCMMRQFATNWREIQRFLLEAAFTCGLKPCRDDAEVKVSKVSDELWEITYEAPQQEGDDKFLLNGYAVRSLLRIYSRGSRQYVKLVECRQFHPHRQDSTRDYYVLKECARGSAVLPGSVEEKIVKMLTEVLKA